MKGERRDGQGKPVFNYLLLKNNIYYQLLCYLDKNKKQKKKNPANDLGQIEKQTEIHKKTFELSSEHQLSLPM